MSKTLMIDLNRVAEMSPLYVLVAKGPDGRFVSLGGGAELVGLDQVTTELTQQLIQHLVAALTNGRLEAMEEAITVFEHYAPDGDEEAEMQEAMKEEFENGDFN